VFTIATSDERLAQTRPGGITRSNDKLVVDLRLMFDSAGRRSDGVRAASGRRYLSKRDITPQPSPTRLVPPADSQRRLALAASRATSDNGH
jgi:hypothetical protein